MSWIFFYLYISVAVFVLMNLVTALIVENAITNSRKDEDQLLAQKEQTRQQELVKFQQLFEMIDADGDGKLTWSEFEASFDEKEVSTKLKLLDFQPDDCREIFLLLDTGDGSLSLEEFFDGITRMEGTAQARDVFKIMKQTEVLVKLLSHMSKEVHEDLGEILRHTPGALLKERRGNLRTRSYKGQDGGPPMDSPSATPMSPMSPPQLQASPQFANFHGHSTNDVFLKGRERPTPTSACKAVSLEEVLLSVQEVSQKLVECQLQFNEKVESCDRKVAAVATEVTELRSGLSTVLQRLGGEPGLQQNRGREVPSCCSSSAGKRLLT